MLISIPNSRQLSYMNGKRFFSHSEGLCEMSSNTYFSPLIFSSLSIALATMSRGASSLRSS